MKLVSVYDSVAYESKGALKQYQKQLDKINKLTDHYRSQTDDQLKASIAEIKKHFNLKDKKLIVHLYAITREVTFRLLGKFQYDVQVLGGLAALERKMIQMSTGSGKTITLILPVVAYGMTGKGCNVLTVNEYLSERDWNETKPVYDFFGLTNAYVNNDMPEIEQQAGFNCDITYSTNSTLGFAYLNSNLASGIGQDLKIIERPLHAAIIDEVDEILMDDARNPLIIAQEKDTTDELATVEHNGMTYSIPEIVNVLKTLRYMERDDEDEKGEPFIGDRTWDEIQGLFGWDNSIFTNQKLMHVIASSCDAIFKHKAYEDYVVSKEPDEDSGSRIILIDKATGRLSHGRTLSDNLHAFVEMKEGVFTGSGNSSSIQITYQVLFSVFEHIAGVTGTLGSSFKEFKDIYEASVVVIPDRKPNKLKQFTNVYVTGEHLLRDLIRKINLYQASRHPVLVGCTSDNDARLTSDFLKRHGVAHRLLVSTDTNEDVVVASAGKVGSVVVTTDIMGRGTDIHVEETEGERGLVVLQLGSRPNLRVERQFAGRAARQGEPGRYHRMLSLADLIDAGVIERQLKLIGEYERSHRKAVHELYHGDLMMNGTAPYYDDVVKEIDEALRWSESAISQQRVDDFKMTSITDLIQLSTIAKLDKYRKIVKDSLDTKDDKLLRETVVELSLPEKYRTPQFMRIRFEECAHLTLEDLQNLLFDYTQHIAHEVIQNIRDYSDVATNTSKLSTIVKLDTQPADYMMRLMRDYMRDNEEMFWLKIDGISNSALLK